MSDFKMLRPAPITSANLTSNIVDSETEFSMLVTYGLAAVVQDTTGAIPTNHRYESLVSGNLGNSLSDETKWLDLGATNKWAMFDNVNGTTTDGSSGVDVSVAITGRADGLGLLNVTAESVHVTMTSGGVTVYDQTYNQVSVENITDWYAYFSEEIVYKTDLVLTDLPLVSNPTVRTQVTSAAGPVSVGQMVVGQTRTLGGTVYGGASIGIQDFSRKTEDADFGTASLTVRGYAKRADFKIVMPEVTADSVARLLAQYRAQNVLWIGSEDYTSTWIFGWVKDWGIDFVLYGQANATLQIEGII